MDRANATRSELRTETSELRRLLGEAEETLLAIRRGEVDTLVVDGLSGPRLFTISGRDAENNRFRGEILAKISDAVIVSDRQSRIVYLNAAAERLYGVAASEALGREVAEVFTVRWRSPEDAAAADDELRESGEWRGENVQVTRDGRALQVESRVTAMREPAGERQGWLSVVRDVSERNRRENELRVSEIRFRRLFEAAHDGILLLDPDTRKVIEANPFMTQMLGLPHEYFVGKELFEIGLLKDAADSQEMFRRLKATNQARYDNLPLEGRNGRHQEVEVVANLYDESGRTVIQCNVRDITERKRAEEHIKLLMAEVNHRAKNLLAVVQAVLQQTARHGDMADFERRLTDRIAGLAVGQDLLVKTEWQGIELSDLVRAQLAHFRELFGVRLRFEGPSVWIAAGPAQGIGMALHELSTNAAKYGALSNQSGIVDIHWALSRDPEPQFSMSWLERGGPKVDPPSRKGFGQMVIGRMAEAAVDGTAEVEFQPEGISWTLSAVAANVLTPSRAQMK